MISISQLSIQFFITDLLYSDVSVCKGLVVNRLPQTPKPQSRDDISARSFRDPSINKKYVSPFSKVRQLSGKWTTNHRRQQAWSMMADGPNGHVELYASSTEDITPTEEISRPVA